MPTLTEKLADARHRQLNPPTLAQLPRDEYIAAKASVCVHEAAHAIASVMAGGHIINVEILENAPGRFGNMSHYAGNMTEDEEMKIALAGPYADARLAYGPNPSIRSIHSLLTDQCAADGKSGDWDRLVASGMPVPWEVGRLIETCWPAVQRLACHLNDHGTADHAVVCAALGLDVTDGHLTAAASQIRAGFPPTPPHTPGCLTHS